MERTDAPVHSRRPFHVDHIQASIFTGTRNCSVQTRICVKLIVIICVKNSDVQSVLCRKCLALISAEGLIWPPPPLQHTNTHTHVAAARWTWHRFSVTRPQLRGREGDYIHHFIFLTCNAAKQQAKADIIDLHLWNNIIF